MKTIKIDLKNYTKKEIQFIADEILKERVVVLPTDTVYGLHCLATNEKAIAKIYHIKKRKASQQKHIILLVKSFCMIRKYCFLGKRQYNYLKKVWSGRRATTVILKGRPSVTLKNIFLREIVSEDDGIAVRLPNNKFLLDLIKEINEPIASTSLNITGEKELKNIDKIETYFKEQKPDLVVDTGRLSIRKPSRLEDIRNMNDIKIYRK